MRKIITLLTDFGLRDHYAGVMKGVILGINPDAVIVDITHEIRNYHIYEAAFKLRNSYSYFPKGTIHVAVVDPGVGGPRRPLAAEAGGYYFVGPDNGIFSPVLESAGSPSVVEITRTEFMLENISTTFHGRDVFAPAAAHLSNGVSIHDLGSAVPHPVSLDVPKPSMKGDEITGVVLYADSFGNLVTNIPGNMVNPDMTVYAGQYRIGPVKSSYGEVGKGDLLAIIGSSGSLEISVNRGSAREVLNKERVFIRIARR
ncbi:MAG TPA: SAM-dependent chlorinase/fluorinase [Thermodesulfobacteriota bacterium]|nr:SAM-dependent chlorinase/fluorinase [Thermodesulfobacteriota bacterium]